MKTLYLVLILSWLPSLGLCHGFKDWPLYNRIEDIPIRKVIVRQNDSFFRIQRSDVKDTILVVIRIAYDQTLNKMGHIRIDVRNRKSPGFINLRRYYEYEIKTMNQEGKNEIQFVRKLLNGIDLAGMGKRKELPYISDSYGVLITYLAIPTPPKVTKLLPKKRK